jgi:hypothetical protein
MRKVQLFTLPPFGAGYDTRMPEPSPSRNTPVRKLISATVPRRQDAHLDRIIGQTCAGHVRIAARRRKKQAPRGSL